MAAGPIAERNQGMYRTNAAIPNEPNTNFPLIYRRHDLRRRIGRQGIGNIALGAICAGRTSW